MPVAYNVQKVDDVPPPPLGRPPVIIIGAARSGTNMLRDLLTQIPGVVTWPCDEINYIWRHYNARIHHDELTPDHATERVRVYIRNAFHKLARQYDNPVVIEKTCANALRIDFVHRILPEAKYLFLVRDGRDVVLSAAHRWTATVEPWYLLQKARFVPLSDLPYYAVRYAGHRLLRLFSPRKALPTWGPRFRDMDLVLPDLTLEEVYALQWKHASERAAFSLAQLAEEVVCQVHYEKLVERPVDELRRICQWVGTAADQDLVTRLATRVRSTRVARWQTAMHPVTLQRIEQLCGSTLEYFGYKPSPSFSKAA